MPLQETSGTASYDAFGGGAPVAAKYIEQYFSTWLRTGTGASATITTGLDASANKALVWTKSRSAATDHKLTDTVRGATKALISDTTGAQTTDTNGLTAFSSTGYTIGSNTNYNNSGATYVDWEFVATPKFFDVVTYTGNGSTSARSIPHSLGSAPGFIIVKRTDTTSDWAVWHRSVSSYGKLNSTAAFVNGASVTNGYVSGSAAFGDNTQNFFVNTVPPNTVNDVNASGGTYVAYLFAHDAGGFGLTGTDNVISCGSYTLDGSNPTTVNLGYEPQFLIWKASSTTGVWFTADNMRGLTTSNCSLLFPNLSNGESTGSILQSINATGFTAGSTTAGTYIYIAIRRGPMKTPTSGTSVFSPSTSSAASGTAITTNFPVDLQINRQRGSVVSTKVVDRMRGITSTPTETNNPIIWINEATAESAGSGWTQYWRNTGFNVPSGLASQSSIYWSFARAPGFFDVVAYSGNGGSNRAINHNLGVAPELIIIKNRTDGAQNWVAYAAGIGNTVGIFPNSNSAAQASSTIWNNTSPTSSVFTVGSGAIVNTSPNNYIAYLFASCPGVSKVGSYTGTGATQTISCGFAARFVLIKRTDSTGDWFVWDTARGMVAGTDPRLALNSTAAETNANWVYTNASGFQIVTTDATVNASGGSYIYLAIA